ncbi:MAG TPA: hypothetical protein VD962_03210, partial [Rubricoccaceae bacterium]|nr:hypothetical protein [Rubricoccaceae bacterium]
MLRWIPLALFLALAAVLLAPERLAPTPEAAVRFAAHAESSPHDAIAARPHRARTTVNAVLGDESFVATFGRLPGPGDSEDLRIRTHLAYVERLLRARDVRHLSPALRAARARNLDRLHAYWTAGVFPRNTVEPHFRTPVFIDEAGRICAMGFLFEQDAGRAAAERINERFQTALLGEIEDAALADWLATSGLTAEEAAMVQPCYSCQYAQVTFSFSTEGPTICGSNENPNPMVSGHPAITVGPMTRQQALACEDELDDVFGTSGFSETFDPSRSIRFQVNHAGGESYQTSFIDFNLWRDASGPSEVRLLYSLDGGTTFIPYYRTYAVTTTPTYDFALFGWSPPRSNSVIFAFEARGGTGTLYFDTVRARPQFTPVELTRFDAIVDGDAVALA